MGRRWDGAAPPSRVAQQAPAPQSPRAIQTPDRACTIALSHPGSPAARHHAAPCVRCCPGPGLRRPRGCGSQGAQDHHQGEPLPAGRQAMVHRGAAAAREIMLAGGGRRAGQKQSMAGTLLAPPLHTSSIPATQPAAPPCAASRPAPTSPLRLSRLPPHTPLPPHPLLCSPLRSTSTSPSTTSPRAAWSWACTAPPCPRLWRTS